jgi:hypothetical protein
VVRGVRGVRGVRSVRASERPCRPGTIGVSVAAHREVGMKKALMFLAVAAGIAGGVLFWRRRQAAATAGSSDSLWTDSPSSAPHAIAYPASPVTPAPITAETEPGEEGVTRAPTTAGTRRSAHAKEKAAQEKAPKATSTKDDAPRRRPAAAKGASKKSAAATQPAADAPT